MIYMLFDVKRKILSRYRKRKYQYKIRINPFGRRTEKNFYVIRIKHTQTGLMSYINTMVWHFLYAEENDYIPFVDMYNYRSTYQDGNCITKKNVWDYYFVQSYALKEVYKSKKIVFSHGDWTDTSSPVNMCELLTGEQREKYFDIFNRYMMFSKETLDHLDEEYRKIWTNIIPENKVLGVVIRGTDLKGRAGHAVQPELQEWFEIIEQYMKEWGCNVLYVASDEQANIEACINYFEHVRVIYNEALRFDDVGDKILGSVKFKRKNDGYLRGLEYLTTIYLLSKCDSLIGTKVGATSGALAFNKGKYEHIEIVDKGFY